MAAISRTISAVLLGCVLGLASITSVHSWTVVPASSRHQKSSSTTFLQSNSNGEDNSSIPQDEQSDAKKQQEMMFESMSLKGAEAVAKMDVPERAKRAMLAEAVEDRIFELTEKLEGFVDEAGMIAEADREKAVEIAKQTKGLQIQYNELVSGGPSSILDSLNAMNGLSKE